MKLVIKLRRYQLAFHQLLAFYTYNAVNQLDINVSDYGFIRIELKVLAIRATIYKLVALPLSFLRWNIIFLR